MELFAWQRTSSLMSVEALNSRLVFVLFIAYSSEKLQEIVKGRDSLLEKIKVFNQDLWICRTVIVPVLKQVIDFITFWNDPFGNGNVTVLNTFEIFKQPVLIAMHKNRSFPLRISSVNVNKSAGNCGFGHIY